MYHWLGGVWPRPHSTPATPNEKALLRRSSTPIEVGHLNSLNSTNSRFQSEKSGSDRLSPIRQEGVVKPCLTCGELRKLTQGLCAVCFMTGGSGVISADERPERPARHSASKVELRLPELNVSPETRPRSPIGSKKKSAKDSGPALKGATKRPLGSSLTVPNLERVPVIALSPPSPNGSASCFRKGRNRDSDDRQRASSTSPRRGSEHTSDIRGGSDPGLFRCFDSMLNSVDSKIQLGQRAIGERCFMAGDCVVSLISRLRQGQELLELGSEGTVVCAIPEECPSAGQASLKLLVQFKLGFDWLVNLNQVCHQSEFQAVCAVGLCGGFKWGDRVQSLVEQPSPQLGKRGIDIGDSGVIIGPGATDSKVGVRFDIGGAEWSLWPTAICKADAFAFEVSRKLAGGFRRGDRVKIAASKLIADALPNSNMKSGGEGVVVGPGHEDTRVLVKFDILSPAWSVDPKMILLSSRK